MKEVADKSDRLCHFMLILASLCLNGFFLGNLWLDEASRAPRLAVWIFFFALTGYSLRAAVHTFIVALCLFENLTLRAGYPNQFLIECGALAILAGFSAFAKSRRETGEGKPGMAALIRLPTAVPLIFAIFFTLFSFANYLLFLKGLSPDPYSAGSALFMLVKRILDWDVSEHNLMHPPSLMYTHLLYLCFMALLCRQWKGIFKNQLQLLRLVVVSAFIVYGYALLEAFNLIEKHHPGGISGTFQNPNHLSFLQGWWH